MIYFVSKTSWATLVLTNYPSPKLNSKSVKTNPSFINHLICRTYIPTTAFCRRWLKQQFCWSQYLILETKKNTIFLQLDQSGTLKSSLNLSYTTSPLLQYQSMDSASILIYQIVYFSPFLLPFHDPTYYLSPVLLQYSANLLSASTLELFIYSLSCN